MPLVTLRPYLTQTKKLSKDNITSSNAVYITVGDYLFDKDYDKQHPNVLRVDGVIAPYVLALLEANTDKEFCFIGSDDTEVGKAISEFITASVNIKKSFKNA